MALIACPDCNAQISDLAPACPHCGRPGHTGHSSVQVVEATGREWKQMQLGGAAAAALGVVVWNSRASNDGIDAILGIVLFLGGFAGILLGRFGAWWHHG